MDEASQDELQDEQKEPIEEKPELEPTSEPEVAQPRRGRGGFWFFGTLILIAILAFVNSRIYLPYYILGPGDAEAVKTYLVMPPEKSKGENGKILLATVSLLQATPVDFVIAKLTPGDDIDGKSEVIPPATSNSQYQQENEVAKDDSQETATQVALTRAGYPVKQLGDGAQVVQVANNTPAVGKLNAGDAITSVNGVTVGTADEAVEAIGALSAGATVHLQVKDTKNATRSVDVVLGTKPDGSGPYVGVLLETLNSRLQTPFPVSFKKTDFGGPSAGLAFTLTILDELTPGELTGGQTIAATGTIAPDGTVGPVGGVKQKTIAVQKKGAKIFLVPPDEYNDAKKAAKKGLTVIPVNSLDQAIAALASHGGNASGIPAVSK